VKACRLRVLGLLTCARGAESVSCGCVWGGGAAGMLQNYGGLALERLNALLRLFVVSTPKYDKTPEQLQVRREGGGGVSHA
jgi:hypothetical protein